MDLMNEDFKAGWFDRSLALNEIEIIKENDGKMGWNLTLISLGVFAVALLVSIHLLYKQKT